MAKFVQVEALDGRTYLVNPDRVAYVTARLGSGSIIMFEAVTGGAHRLELGLEPPEVAAVFEAMSNAPRVAKPPPKPKAMARRRISA